MLTRREFLAATAAAATLAATPSGVVAQTPKRGGTLSVRAWDPPHFDHSLVHAYKTHVVVSFTHSRLLRHRAGPGVRPGSLVLEGDLAKQQYYVHAPAGTYIAVWDGALKNYGPNLGYDYGSRVVAAWLDR